MKIGDVQNWGKETATVKRLFRNVGCDLVGVAPIEPFPELKFFENWLDRGFAGEMDYLHRQREKSLNPQKILRSVQSVLVCGQVYESPFPHEGEEKAADRGWISRYAWGDDYHEVLMEILRQGVQSLQERFENLEYRVYVDTGPARDRIWARHAGLGWFGKNSCLINQKVGSYFFIGEVFLNLPLIPDQPVAERCGSCTRCLDSCPTGAIVEPGVVDSRKCISYVTIELKTAIPKDLRKRIGRHIFGCDICQDVCPWNRRVPDSHVIAYEPREGFLNPDLKSFYQMVKNDYPKRFKKSPLKRSKQRGLFRNIAVAMGNSGQRQFLPQIQEMAQNADELVREHGQWALEQIDAQKNRSKN